MTTKKICVLLCFNHSFMKVIFIQGAFNNIQGLLWKIQGLFKDIPLFFNFQGLFKDMMLFQALFKACENHVPHILCDRSQIAQTLNKDRFDKMLRLLYYSVLVNFNTLKREWHLDKERIHSRLTALCFSLTGNFNAIL